jgi:hypothetical protein
MTPWQARTPIQSCRPADHVLLASLMAFWGFKRRLPSVASCLRVPRGQSFATERNTADHLHRRPSYRRHGSVDPLEKVGDGLMVVNHSGGLRAVGHSKVSIAVVPRARKIFEIREPFAGDEGPAEKPTGSLFRLGRRMVRWGAADPAATEEQGVYPPIGMGPLSEPLQVFQHAIKRMIRRNFFTLPETTISSGTRVSSV